MTIDPKLIERIYEAAIVPQVWPAVLQDIADHIGAVGAVFMNQSLSGMTWTASPAIERSVDAYVTEGWAAAGTRTAEFLAEQYPGFRAETAYRSVEDIAGMPVMPNFLRRTACPQGQLRSSKARTTKLYG